jgi:hypothetical protein
MGHYRAVCRHRAAVPFSPDDSGQARDRVDLSLLGSFGLGLWYDLLAASYAVVPWFLLTLLLPPALWRSKAARWVVSFLLLLYAVVFLFIGVSEWFFWDEFQVRFNFIAVTT